MYTFWKSMSEQSWWHPHGSCKHVFLNNSLIAVVTGAARVKATTMTVSDSPTLGYRERLPWGVGVELDTWRLSKSVPGWSGLGVARNFWPRRPWVQKSWGWREQVHEQRKVGTIDSSEKEKDGKEGGSEIRLGFKDTWKCLVFLKRWLAMWQLGHKELTKRGVCHEYRPFKVKDRKKQKTWCWIK